MHKTERIIDKLDQVIKSDGGLIAEEDLNMDELKDVIDDCYLVKFEDDKFKFAFMGKNIIEAFGHQFFSEDINNLILPSNHAIAADFKKVLETKKPIEAIGIFSNNDDIKIKYRKKIYPLTDKAGSLEVKYIFGGMRWKAQI
jgi:hypothetical protein